MKILGGGFLRLVYALLILLHMQTSVGINSTIGDDEVRCIDSERLALLAFKRGLVDEHGRLSSWGSEEEKKDCCKWGGVQCGNSTGHVVVLSLPGNNFELRGNLSPSLFELQHLTYLDLSFINFKLNHIPGSIDSLNKIQHLNLSFCNLSGSLPSQLANLTSLQYLDLSYNEFKVENLSPSLFELQHLTYLNLQGIDFNLNHIRESIGSLNKIQHLDLCFCNLCGSLPSQLANLTGLQFLDLSYNEFKVENLSPSLFELQHLTYLNLQEIDFNLNHILESISSLNKIQHLDLSSCNLSGPLTSQLVNLTSLQYLDLSYNKFKVENLSPSLFELQHLTYLNLQGIDFNLNHIPESIGSLNKIQHLDMFSCNLSGSLSSQLANLTSLQYLDLSFNNFQSVKNLEWLLFSLSNLQELDLSGIDLSKVTNGLLQIINELPHLNSLFLYDCNLRDVIPQCIPMINTSTSLAFLHLGGNNLSASSFQWLFKFSNSLLGLDLSYNSFEGWIPESFGNLCKLSDLDLSDNNLDVMLLELIGNLSGCLQLSLEWLDLSQNKIKGPLPDMIKNFSSLQSLSLSNNQLNGTVSKSIGFLSKLEQLDISSNSLNGMITESHFSTLSKLRLLDMSFNTLSINFSCDWIPPFQLDRIGLRSCKLGPKFPNWLKTQSKFSQLDISGTGISDSIPKWFGNLISSSKAVEVNLSSNQIYGILPDFSTKFADSSILRIDLSKNKLEGLLPVFPVNVISIKLSNNRFSGSISSLCTITSGNLKFLDVSHNQLYGKLPDCMTRWTSLVILNLANNHLFGKIPSSIGSLYQLESLGLQNNNFFGEIPWSLGNCSALQFLDLSYNSFSGIIPAWIGERLSSLNFLLLRSNKFNGDIPLQLCWLTNIMLLDLSNNNLSGTMPWCIQNLTALAQKESSAHDHLLWSSFTQDTGYFSHLEIHIDEASIMWKGTVYDYINLKNLRIIDLSSNKLTGAIPVKISRLVELVQLNLSRNQLTGRMPPDIGQMRQLESLDLSCNQLSGHPPESMSQLNFLSTLNLSYNNFSGRIPLSTQMQSFNASAFVGNPALCGPPLTPTCPGDENSNSKPIDNGGQENQEDRAEFRKSFKPGVELGAAIGFVGVLAAKLNHPWKHLCFLLFNNVRVRLSNLRDCLYLLVIAVGLLVKEHVSRAGRKLKLCEASVSS